MRLIDADACSALFDAEFKETKRLIIDGEKHLDNLAEGFMEAHNVIRSMPTIDAAPVVHGRWGLLPVSIRSVKKTNIPEAVCSICGERFCDITNSVSLYRFCPNCGAKMDLD